MKDNLDAFIELEYTFNYVTISTVNVLDKRKIK